MPVEIKRSREIAAGRTLDRPRAERGDEDQEWTAISTT
jgi:hypothetical protein